MTKEPLPEIREKIKTETGVNLQLFVPQEHPLFEDHFPNFPLMPGVAQIDWVIRIAVQEFSIEQPMKSLDIIKFVKPIFPNTNLTLELSWEMDLLRLKFAFVNQNHKFANGQITFGDL